MGWMKLPIYLFYYYHDNITGCWLIERGTIISLIVLQYNDFSKTNKMAERYFNKIQMWNEIALEELNEN
jgi:hypothetical protein